MATLGIVSLPGMMTGQILSGEDPMVAIKYQLAIMAAILSASALGSFLSLRSSIRVAFDDYQRLRPDLFS
jgi:putative ABC transport system permease protein